MQDDFEAVLEPKVKAGRIAGAKAAGKAGAKAGGKAAGKTGGKAGAKTAGEGGKAVGPRSAEVQIARMIVRAQWQYEWSTANPEGGQSERKAAWKEVRQARMEANMKSARRVVTSLQRQGVTMILTASAAAQAETAGDEDDDSEA